MSLEPGTWVELADGRVGRVIEIDRERGSALAETSDGEPIDRPLSHADAQWRRLDPDGLRVRRVRDRAGVRQLAREQPVELVVAALRDLDQPASVERMKAALTPDPIAADGFTAWWRRVQPQLQMDARIDTSRARQRLYRLLADGERARTSTVAPVRDELRNGRRVADGKLLASARALAASGKDLSFDEALAVREEGALAGRTDLDPTDRFLAADLLVMAKLRSDQEVRELLGDDIGLVDLLRVRQHASRDRALDWGLGAPATGPGSPLTRSGLAVGPPWDARVLAWARAGGQPIVEVAAGWLGWSVPGSDEAGPPKYPDDLDGYERRIKALAPRVAMMEGAEVRGLIAGALLGLARLAQTGAHAAAWRRVMDGLARLIWQTRTLLPATERRHFELPPALRPDAVDALLRNAPSREDARSLQPALEGLLVGNPRSYWPQARLLAQRAGLDVGQFGLALVRRRVADTAAPAIAALLLEEVRDRVATDGLAAEVALLAAALDPTDRDVARLLEQIASQRAEEVLRGEPPQPTAVAFVASDWATFVGRLERHLATEERSRQEAERERDRLREEVERLTEALRMRSEALESTRTEAGAAGRAATLRLAANLMKPVALAVADSYEARSLEAVRDALLAVLARARIEPIASAGEIVEFDPSLHRWVGSGMPSASVRVLSPGFRALGEEETGAIVLVAARVAEAGA